MEPARITLKVRQVVLILMGLMLLICLLVLAGKIDVHRHQIQKNYAAR
jgi:hypothetical protein